MANVKAEVIDRGMCSYCGACIAACPKAALTTGDDTPVFTEEKCIDCSICLKVCPGYNRDPGPGKTLKQSLATYAARTLLSDVAEVCQDGGVVTTLAITALEEGLVDCVLACGAGDKPLQPKPVVARTREEVLATAGSKYSYCPTLSKLKDVLNHYGKIMVVGLPLQLKALDLYLGLYRKYSDKTVFRIGIFCFENFPYKAVTETLARLEVDPSTVRKIQIKKGRFIVYAGGSQRDIPISDLGEYVRPACRLCPVLLPEYADVAVGGLGVPQGWSCVVVWNKAGGRLLEAALNKGFLELEPLPEKARKTIIRLAKIKAKRASKT